MADSTLYKDRVQILDEAGEKMSGNDDAMLQLAATAARIKVAHARMASSDPTIFGFSTDLDAQRQHIMVTLTTMVDGRRPRASGTPGRNACLLAGMIYRWSNPSAG